MGSATATETAPHTTTTVRWMFGIYFIAVGTLHFVLPDGLPAFMAWMYELSEPVHAIAGTAEILGGLGLVLPNWTGVLPRLTSAAASGLAILMVGAATWHVGRGEWVQVIGNLVVAGIMAYVAIAEWRTQRR